MAGQAAVTADLVDEEVEAVLAEFDGDVRRAIRALLDDLAALAEDRAKGAISSGPTGTSNW